MIPDAYILERRLLQLQRLPWPLAASIVMGMTSEDLDALDMAEDNNAWWKVLNAIVARITDNGDEEATQ